MELGPKITLHQRWHFFSLARCDQPASSGGLRGGWGSSSSEIESTPQSQHMLDGRFAVFYRTVWDRNSTLKPLADHAESFACEDLLACMCRWRCHFNPPSRYALRRTVHHTLSRWGKALSYLGFDLNPKDVNRLQSFQNRAVSVPTDSDIEWIHEAFELPSALICAQAYGLRRLIRWRPSRSFRFSPRASHG